MVTANSVLLAAASDVFERMLFDERFPRAIVDGVHLIEEPDVSLDVFQAFKRSVRAKESAFIAKFSDSSTQTRCC